MSNKPPKHSTGALLPERHTAQDKVYAEGHDYDYLIIGSGSSALTVGALLAQEGYKICILEAHDVPGGYAHTFKMGDWSFCAQIHYIWGCAEGQKVYSFLKKLGLEKDITFELLGEPGKGYDQASLPDGKKVFIPYGFDNLEKNIEAAYPGQGANAGRFLREVHLILNEMRKLPSDDIRWWQYLLESWKVPHLLKYRSATVQNLFDRFQVGKEAQAILCADAGDFGLPPRDLSIFMYAALFGGYNSGAYYPTRHFKYYIQRLADYITEHDGCHIFYETEAVKVHTDGDQVTHVETKDGKVFKGKNVICNMDPQTATERLIGWDKFPTSYQPKLKYEYSQSGVMIYLGLKNIDLREHGFGSYNIWHLEDWDMNAMWDRSLNYDLSKPWIFMSTPTLHTDDPSNAPAGGQILQIATFTGYDQFEALQKEDYFKYNQLKIDLALKMLDIVSEKFVPNLREHVALQVIGSPMTNVDYCMAPRGNAYGSNMTPAQIAHERLKESTPFKNFYWCNASSGFAGIYGTVGTGVALYEKLTGDRFYSSLKAPSDDSMVQRANELLTTSATR